MGNRTSDAWKRGWIRKEEEDTSIEDIEGNPDTRNFGLIKETNGKLHWV
jgi:hypothetical protein